MAIWDPITGMLPYTGEQYVPEDDQQLRDYLAWLQTNPAQSNAGVPPHMALAGMSQPEYDANYLNNRLQSALVQIQQGNPDHPNATGFLAAMHSRGGVRPEQIQSAMSALNASGDPMLSEALMAQFGRWGAGPLAYPGAAEAAPPPPAGNTKDRSSNGGGFDHAPSFPGARGTNATENDMSMGNRQRYGVNPGTQTGDFDPEYLRREQERLYASLPPGYERRAGPNPDGSLVQYLDPIPPDDGGFGPNADPVTGAPAAPTTFPGSQYTNHFGPDQTFTGPDGNTWYSAHVIPPGAQPQAVGPGGFAGGPDNGVIPGNNGVFDPSLGPVTPVRGADQGSPTYRDRGGMPTTGPSGPGGGNGVFDPSQGPVPRPGMGIPPQAGTGSMPFNPGADGFAHAPSQPGAMNDPMMQNVSPQISAFGDYLKQKYGGVMMSGGGLPIGPRQQYGYQG